MGVYSWYMETIENKEGGVRNPEAIKWQTFYDITRSALFGIKMAKEEGITMFISGGKEHKITNIAAAIKAFGQVPASVMESVYKKTVQI